ncbi:MAG TPA: hypothetical protein VNI20_05350 [Fimbriimonadaceae bacterium]|nr:hypothetical protein [Fimbriimonadaceae bacterium]
MATVEDIRTRKKVRSEFTKRMIDITGMDLQVLHGVAYVRGVIKPIKGGPTDLKAELELIATIVKNANLVKDCVIDATIRT